MKINCWSKCQSAVKKENRRTHCRWRQWILWMVVECATVATEKKKFGSRCAQCDHNFFFFLMLRIFQHNKIQNSLSMRKKFLLGIHCHLTRFRDSAKSLIRIDVWADMYRYNTILYACILRFNGHVSRSKMTTMEDPSLSFFD